MKISTTQEGLSDGLLRSKTETFGSFVNIGTQIVKNQTFPRKRSSSNDFRAHTPYTMNLKKNEKSSFKITSLNSKSIVINQTINNNITIINKTEPQKVERTKNKKLTKSILKIKFNKHKNEFLARTQSKIQEINKELQEAENYIPKKRKSVKFDVVPVISKVVPHAEVINQKSITPRSFKSCQSISFKRNAEIKLRKEIKKVIEAADKCHYTKHLGCFEGFCAFTCKNQEKSNNDKLSIFINKIFNVKKIEDIVNEKYVLNFFGLHHGIDGDYVSSQLKDNLHKYIFESEFLLTNPRKAIRFAYKKIENELKGKFLKSLRCGSCSIIILSINNKILISNLGDSKCVISLNNSFDVYKLSSEHTPANQIEANRLNESNVLFKKMAKYGNKYKIFPSGIKTTRILGHFDSKIIPSSTNPFEKTNKKSNGIISAPETFEISSKDQIDFLILVNDEVCDFLSNRDLVLTVYQSLLESMDYEYSLEKALDNIVTAIFSKVIDKCSKGNLSIIFVFLKNFLKLYKERERKKVLDIINQLTYTTFDFNKIYPYIHACEETENNEILDDENLGGLNEDIIAINEKKERLKTENSIVGHTKLEIRSKNCGTDFQRNNTSQTPSFPERKKEKKKKCFSFCSCFL